MSDNLLLVKFFIREVFKNQAIDAKKLSYLASTNFSYYLDMGICMDFDEFIERMKVLFSSSTIELGKIESDDDVHFYCEFEVKLIKQSQGSKMYGLAQVVVRSGFIQKITINYHESQKDFLEFRDSIKNTTTVYL